MSEVLGSVILVSISVVVLTGFGAMVLSTVTKDAPAVPTASFEMEPVVGASSVNVSFFSGTPFQLQSAALVMLVNSTDRTGTYYANSSSGDGLFHPGDALIINLTGAPLAAGDTLFLLMNDKVSGRSIGTAHGTILASPTQPGYTEDLPSVLSFALSPSPLVADGVTFSNLSVTVDATRGLALIRSVVVNMSPVFGDPALVLLDAGSGADALAVDGTYTASVTARNVTFHTSSLPEQVPLTVTVTDILGHQANFTIQLTVTPPPPGPVVQGSVYGPILSSAQLGWLNLTDFAFRDQAKLPNDQVVVRVADAVDPTIAWSALVSFNSTSTCGSTYPGVSRIELFRDGVAGSSVYTPSGASCFTFGPGTELNLANILASTNATGAVQAWNGGAPGYNYSDAGISSDNTALITFFGDSQSVAPSSSGLGQGDISWGPIGPINTPPTASFIVTQRPDFSPYMRVDVDGTGSFDSDGSVAAWVWDWGDSTSGSGSTATHTYATAGTFTIRLTVTDNGGGTAQYNRSVTADHPPSAAFTSVVTGLAVDFTSTSTDPDAGDVLTYAWEFGDGNTDTGATPSHTYATGGNYTVNLTVTDTVDSLTDRVSHVVAPNRAPIISGGTTETNNRTAFWNVSASDPDGQAIQYTVAWGDGNFSVAGSGATANLTHTYAVNGTYSATLFVNDTFNAFDSASTTFTAALNAPPDISAASGAANLLVGFLNATAHDPENQSIVYTVVWNDGNFDTSGNLSSIAKNHTYAVAGIYTVTLYVNDTQGGVASQSFTLTIDRPPSISTITNTTSALNLTLTVTATDPDAGDSIAYAYVWGDGNVDTGATNVQDHTYATAGSYTVRVYANDTFGMGVNTTYAVLPNVAPVIGTITNTTSALNLTLTVPFTDTDSGQTWTRAYVWGDGQVTTSGSSPQTHTYASAGSFTVRVYVNDSLGGSATTTYAVLPDSLPTFGSITNTTASLNVTLTVPVTDTDTGQTVTRAYVWGDGTVTTSGTSPQSHTYTSAGAYTVRIYANDTLGGSAQTTYAVLPDVVPVIGSITNTTTGLGVTLTVPFTDTDAGQSWTTTYVWGDGVVDTNNAHTYSAAGSYSVRVYVNDSLGGSATTTYAVLPNALPTFGSITNSTASLNVTLTVPVTDPDGQAITRAYVWGDGTVTSSGSSPQAHTYASAGSYTVTIYANDSLGGSSSTTYAVLPNVVPVIGSITNTTSALNVTITLPFTDTDSGQTWTRAYVWGDGQVTASGTSPQTHTYATAGLYTVRVYVNDSLGGSATTTYGVLPDSPPSITLISNSTVSLNVTLAVTATDTDGQALSYAYVWGDGSNTASGTSTQGHTYTSAGAYTVRVYVNDTLGGSATTTYAVLPDALPSITGVSNSTASLNVTVSVTATDTDAGQTLTYAFVWGDGQVSSGTSSQLHTYATAGSYTVRLYANDTLGGSATTTYAVLPNVVPIIGSITNTTTNLGVTLTVPFTDTDSGQTWTTTYVWGDGVVNTNAAHTYSSAGSYTVRVYVNDSLGGSATTTYAVLPNQAPSISGITNTTTDLGVTLTVTASDPDGQALTYAYVWGDGQVTTGATNVQAHSFATAGSYTVRVYANDTLGGSTSTTYAVLPNTVPVIGSISNSTASLNVTITLPFTDPDSQTWTRAYVWGDGQVTTSGTSPQAHTYSTAGSYTVRVYVNDSLGGSATTTYAVLPNVLPVIGSITNSTASLNVTLTVPFTDTDSGQTWTRAYVWGDGQVTTSGTSPQAHMYSAAGSYTVRVYVNDSLGGSATTTYAVLPNVVPVIGSITNTTSALNVTVTLPFTDTDSGQTWTRAYVWGDGQVTASGTSPQTHTYTSAGSYTVRAYVNDSLGGSATTTYAVLPNSLPTITASPNSTAALAAFVNATATDTDAGQTLTYTIAWGDASGTNSAGTGSFSHLYSSAGTYTVTLFVNDTLGGSTSTTMLITVAANTAPIIDTFTHVTNLLVGFVNVTSHDPDAGDSVATTVVAWGDSSTPTSTIGSTATVSHTYVAGTYTVTIYTNDTRGGSTSQTSVLTPNRPPTFTSLTNTTSDLNATLTPSASDPDGQTITYTYAWGDGQTTTTTSTPQTHQYSLPGNYTVTVYANDTLGGSVSTTNLVQVIQTIWVGTDDTNFQTPGGTVNTTTNLQASDLHNANYTETTGTTPNAQLGTGCDSVFQTTTPLSCTLGGLTWHRNTSLLTGTWTANLASSQGTPVADGALEDSPTANGVLSDSWDYYFNISASSATTLTNLSFDWKITANGGIQTRSIAGVLIAPNGTSLTIGTASTTTNTAWARFTASANDNWLTSGGQYILRVTYTSSKNGDVFDIDNINLNWTSQSTYRLQKLLTLTPVPTGGNHYLEIKAKQSANLEPLQIQVFDGSTWNVKGTITNTTLQSYTYKLNSADYSSGTIQVRLVDTTTSSDASASSWDVDYVRDTVYG